MATLDAFLPLIRKHISGPLEMMMTQAARDAAITFCRESLFCRDAVTFDQVIPEATYRLTESKQVKSIKWLRVMDVAQWLRAGIDFTAPCANEIRFHQPLTRVTVDFVIEPRRGATEVPEVLLADYAEVIAMGALEDLLIMPGKPWTDPPRSHYFGQRFVEGYRRAFRVALENSPIAAFNNPVRQHEFF
ncbi:hypothetical protein [Yersinia mollaretii]|uniref:hypothetical protein n=1 Tax=Yersinia mollaretii TaxID=33060 RepID=UPI00119CACCD|nr:hypothetical protein [Yersinia mollaretii]